MKTFLFSFLLLSLTTELLQAQHIEDCQVDYSKLKKSAFLELANVGPDKVLYLSANYVRGLREGKPTYEAAKMMFYEYVRPASKKEIKTGEIENETRELIGLDNNIYAPQISSQAQHFFIANEAFKGSYRPSVLEDQLVVPMGLEPFDVIPFAEEKFWVVERKTDYLLLEIRDQQIVYYIDFPKMEKVFESQAVRDHLEMKREEAKRLEGDSWLIKHNDLPQYRSQSELYAPREIFHLSPLLELDFQTAQIFQDRVVFPTNEDSLRIDHNSDFLILDKNCVLGQQNSYAESLMETFDTENIRLNKILKDQPVEDWAEEPWVMAALMKRFWLLPSKRIKSRYQYVLLGGGLSFETFLHARLDVEGKAWLASHYASTEGLYHRTIRIYKGNSSLYQESERISTRDRRSKRTYEEEWIVEEIDFDGEGDLDLVELIAKNVDRKITIRYYAGGKYFKDVELAAFYKEQIRDVYMLSQIIKRHEYARKD